MLRPFDRACQLGVRLERWLNLQWALPVRNAYAMT